MSSPAVNAEYKEAFALADKKGTGKVPRDKLGDLLRCLGQNPTQADVKAIEANAPAEVDYPTFLTILNRPEGFKPSGSAEEFIAAFRVFDKDKSGLVGRGELKYILTELGEKMSESEVDEFLNAMQQGNNENINYESLVRQLMGM